MQATFNDAWRECVLVIRSIWLYWWWTCRPPLNRYQSPGSIGGGPAGRLSTGTKVLGSSTRPAQLSNYL